jgi:mycothiol system anti-sigma-R factor
VSIGCAEVRRFTDAFLDGEFAEEERAELERHLAECGECAREVRFQSAFRAALKAAAPRPRAPGELRARLGAELAKLPAPAPPWRRMALKVVPAAAAAALLVGLMWSAYPFSPVVEDAIAKHRRDLPAEVTRPDQVRAWFADKVDFAVRPPRLPPNYVFRGARLANVHEREAAYLVYEVNGDKVSVLVFDPRDVPLQARQHRTIGNHDVYLDGQRGYNVAVYRDRDVGYAFTSEMDQDQMIQLVSTAVGR